MTGLFSVTGLFVALIALPDFIVSIYELNQLRPIEQDSETGWSQKGKIIGDGLQLMLGIGVMIGAKGFVNVIIWLRGLGR